MKAMEVIESVVGGKGKGDSSKDPVVDVSIKKVSNGYRVCVNTKGYDGPEEYVFADLNEAVDFARGEFDDEPKTAATETDDDDGTEEDAE